MFSKLVLHGVIGRLVGMVCLQNLVIPIWLSAAPVSGIAVWTEQQRHMVMLFWVLYSKYHLKQKTKKKTSNSFHHEYIFDVPADH